MGGVPNPPFLCSFNNSLPSKLSIAIQMGKTDGPFFLPGPPLSFRTIGCFVFSGMSVLLQVRGRSAKKSGYAKVIVFLFKINSESHDPGLNNRVLEAKLQARQGGLVSCLLL